MSVLRHSIDLVTICASKKELENVDRTVFVECLLLLFLSFSLSAATNHADNLAALQATYREALNRIEAEYADKEKNWPAEYTKALKDLQKKMQEAGNFEGWSAIIKEMKRFEADQNIPKETLITAPDELKALQTIYQDVMPKYVLEKSRKVVSLTERYIDSLKKLQKKFTMQNKMEEAMSIDVEIKRTKSSAAVTAAEFEFAEHEAKQVKEQPPETKPVESEKPETQKKREEIGEVSVSQQKAEGIDIYEDGKSPPSIHNVFFKRSSLYPTEYSPVAQKVGISLLLGQRSGADVRSSSVSQYYVRLAVRSAKVGTILNKLTVVVQYFAKNPGKTRGRIEPQRMDVQRIKLSKLDTQYVHIDCCPLPRDTLNYPSSPETPVCWWGNKEFYGIIVSVYDGDGVLVFQGASSSSLGWLAEKDLP